jgi:tyrosinase
MKQALQLAAGLLALASSVSAFPTIPKRFVAHNGTTNGTCTQPTARKPWHWLTPEEQTGYFDATMCLFTTPARSNFPGVVTRWDELQWSHVIQPSFIHDEGQFLPWHRYYMAVHANMLREDCGYHGPIPYWNETADVGNMAQSTVALAFGGDGVGTGTRKCVESGPFVDARLNLRRLDQPPESHCIYRSFNETMFARAAQTNIDNCLAQQTYETAWECWFLAPHAAGHAGIGGVMSDAVLSPGDPLFFMHHGWLDALWWKWQSADLETRLTEMGGRNTLSEPYRLMHNLTFPGPEFTEYDGDPGNVTTLNHVLWMGEVSPNITVADVMDIRGDLFCSEYFYDE